MFLKNLRLIYWSRRFFKSLFLTFIYNFLKNISIFVMFQHGNFVDVEHSNCQRNKIRKKSNYIKYYSEPKI